MTMVPPTPHEDVVPEARRMTSARRARIIARDKHCRYPGCEVETALEVDHILCLELGGSDADHNLQALCGDHHRLKTRQDVAMIARAKRRKAKNDGSFPPAKQKLKGGKLGGRNAWFGRPR